jgi:hypothetical protein
MRIAPRAAVASLLCPGLAGCCPYGAPAETGKRGQPLSSSFWLAGLFPGGRGINGLVPRQLRRDYPGAMHQDMSRGDRREEVYHDAVARQEWVKTLAEACLKADWQETVVSVKRVVARGQLGSDHTARRNLHEWMKLEGRRKVK